MLFVAWLMAIPLRYHWYVRRVPVGHPDVIAVSVLPTARVPLTVGVVGLIVPIATFAVAAEGADVLSTYPAELAVTMTVIDCPLSVSTGT